MGISIVLVGILGFFLFYGRIPTVPLAVAAVGLCLLYGFLSLRHNHHHGRFVSIDIHAQRSRLGCYHPGLKVCFAVACAVVCIAADSIPVSLFLLVSMSFITIYVGGTPTHYYLSLLAIPVVFIILGTVAILFEIAPHPLGLLDISLGSRYLSVTAAGQMRALGLMCKALGAVSCLYFLSLSTPMHLIISVLRRAKIPAVVVELMYLIYRYIFIMLDSQAQMADAAKSRLGYRNWHVSLRTMLTNSFLLLFLSLRRATDCFAAMESRCYDGEIRFLEETPALNRSQVAVAAGYGILLCLIWIVAKGGVL